MDKNSGVKQIIGALLLTIAFLIIVELSTIWIILPPFQKTSFVTFKFVSSIIELLVVIGVIKYFRPQMVLLNRSKTYFYFLGIISGAAFVLLQFPLNSIYNNLLSTNFQFRLGLEFDKNQLLRFLAIVFLSPITEEIFFRLILQKNLQRIFTPIVSIFFVALLFSISHFQFSTLLIMKGFNPLDFHQSYIAFFGSLFSGVLFWKTRSVIPSIMMHITWNGLIFLSFG